jgi:hypothetical protein
MAQKQRLAELEAELESKTLQIQDVDAIVRKSVRLPMRRPARW